MAESVALTALDRCDRCRGPAVARTRHENGDLVWCNHHYEQHKEALALSLVFYDPQSPDVPNKKKKASK